MKSIKLVFFCVMLFLPSMALGQAQVESLDNKDFSKLKKEYDAVIKDRENLLAQMKILLQYKNEITQAKQQLSLVEQERAQWELEKETNISANKRLQSVNDHLVSKLDNLQADLFQVQSERDEMRKTLSKSKAGYIIVDDLNKKIKEQEKEISRSENNLKKMQKEVDSASDQIAKAEATADVLRNQVKEVKSKYKKSVTTNKKLENKINRLPKEYAEIARENKILLKRTALMHYNLGVFYSEKKEYTRAIPEFEKAIELNPEDPQAYFNLGLIYAEQFEDRAKAIDRFQKFLMLTKKEDQDVDWVKKYILTWQTWEGKSSSK
ncbi:MAG: tetratricopeptide repeat protein [Candidatus Omnitrophica bacterium]|nr:tetratricopeptide repeat protein [Candidatus Omnitrophota bacterium]